MYCINCGKQLPDNAKFCPECGTKCGEATTIIKTGATDAGAKTVRLKCRNCQANMEIDASKQEAVCPYCGEKMMILDSDIVAAEKIKSNAYKDVEFAKIENEKNLRESEENKEERDKYRKSRLSKWSIVFVFICIVMTIFSFSNGHILAGIIALLQTGLFSLSWLIGVQIIKVSRKSLSTAAAIVGFILIIPFLIFASRSGGKKTYNSDISTDMELTVPYFETTEAETEAKTTEAPTEATTEATVETTEAATEPVAENTFQSTLDKSQCFTITMGNVRYYIPTWYKVTEQEDDSVTLESIDSKSYNMLLLSYTPFVNNEEIQQYFESDEMFSTLVDEFIDPNTEDTANRTISDLTVANSNAGKIVFTKYLVGSDLSMETTVALFNIRDNCHLIFSLGNETSITDVLGSAEYVKDHEGITISENVETTGEESLSSKETEANAASGIRPEFKTAMDSYEEFFDEYIAFMKKYSNSSNSVSMLNDYLEYIQQYAETMEKMGEIDENELSTEEAKYYLEVMTRINKKLLDAAS